MEHQIAANLVVNNSAESTDAMTSRIERKVSKSLFNNNNISSIRNYPLKEEDHEELPLPQASISNRLASNPGGSHAQKDFDDLNEDAGSTFFSKNTAADVSENKSIFEREPSVPLVFGQGLNIDGVLRHSGSQDILEVDGRELINLNIRVKH